MAQQQVEVEDPPYGKAQQQVVAKQNVGEVEGPPYGKAQQQVGAKQNVGEVQDYSSAWQLLLKHAHDGQLERSSGVLAAPVHAPQFDFSQELKVAYKFF